MNFSNIYLNININIFLVHALEEIHVQNVKEKETEVEKEIEREKENVKDKLHLLLHLAVACKVHICIIFFCQYLVHKFIIYFLIKNIK